jgi:oligopeptide transport system substrate-binding protein
MLAFQSHIPFCKSLQAQWRQNLGVDVNWRPLQTSRYINKLADEQVHLCSLAWMADYPDPVNFLDLNDSIQMGQWHSQRFVALVDRARRETAPQQRMELYGQADKILIEEAAIMPLTYGHKHVLVKPWVKKYPISAFKFWFWKDVVIEPH